ncbi:MAG: apolipoprotein N-acyltransferase [Clostridia bacterium]|nr:apolipoprotein N-acyltransferase [Clostridia bacterium]
MIFFLYFLGFHIPLYSFLSRLYPYERFGFNGSEAVIVLIASCAIIPIYHSLLRSAVMIPLRFIGKNRFAFLSVAALWTLSEWITSIGTLAFPWGTTAVSLTGFLPFVNTASLFGGYFIAFITALICVLAATAIVFGDKSKIFAAACATLFMLNTVSGAVLSILPDSSETVNAALIQGNVLSNEKWVDENRDAIFDKYVSLAEEAAENGAKLIILPESAIPISYKNGGSLYRAFSDIAKRYDTTVIAGVSCYENGVQYNSVIGVLPDGKTTDRYDKRHLVPFGEFIPYADIIGSVFPFVKEFNESSSDYGAGDTASVMDTPVGRYGAVVCFDSIFTAFTRESVTDGAQAIVVVTNDSWFEDSVGIYTHLRHAKLRAIECGRYILRAANTGISAFIEPNGNVSSSTGPLTEAVLYGAISLSGSTTLYTLTGDLFVPVSFGIIVSQIIINLYFFIRRKQKDGKNNPSRERDL